MTDDGRGRGSVNLEELERQLREASRNRARSLSTEFGSPNGRPDDADVPDVVALTRQFISRSNPQPVASTEPDTWRPPAQSQIPSTFGSALYQGQGGESAARPSAAEAEGDPFYPPPPAFMRTPIPSTGPQTSDGGGFQNDFASSFGSAGRDRFPEIERPVRATGRVFRAIVLLLILVIGVGLVYLYETGRFSMTLGVQSDQRQVPVIKPDPNPVKIVPDAKTAEAPPAGTELFTKNSADSVAKVTTRSTAEEPVDINAVTKNAPASKSLVPGMGDPKAVKTVTVRPDGTIVGDAQIAPSNTPTDAAPPVAQPPKNVPLAPQEPSPTPSNKSENTKPSSTPAPEPATATVAALPPLTGPTVDVPLPTPRPTDLGKTTTAAPAATAPDPLAELAKSVTDEATSESATDHHKTRVAHSRHQTD